MSDDDVLSDLRERWADFVARRAELRRLAITANATGDYREYDEASDDHHELGSDLAVDLAAYLGFPDEDAAEEEHALSG